MLPNAPMSKKKNKNNNVIWRIVKAKLCIEGPLKSKTPTTSMNDCFCEIPLQHGKNSHDSWGGYKLQLLEHPEM